MRILLLALLFALPAAAQEVVTLRPHAVVEDPVLRLGAVFDGLDPTRAARPLAAAPAPGRRITLETDQLLALSRAHGLGWRPLMADERVVVERPGRPVPRAEIEAALRAELVPLGLDAAAALDLGALIPPMVPAGSTAHLAAESASFDPTTQRFAATLAVAAEGMPLAHQRIAGRAVPTVPAVVPTRRLALGEIIGPGDVRETRLRAGLVRGAVAETPAQVVGRQLRRPLAPDLPIALADVAAPSLVERNGRVLIVLDEPGMTLAAEGRALEAAPRGGTVRVVNLMSQAVVEGVVVGPGRVRVAAAPRRAGE
jgi:flagella basal body P-ring formation protein FlgA